MWPGMRATWGASAGVCSGFGEEGGSSASSRSAPLRWPSPAPGVLNHPPAIATARARDAPAAGLHRFDNHPVAAAVDNVALAIHEVIVFFDDVALFVPVVFPELRKVIRTAGHHLE